MKILIFPWQENHILLGSNDTRHRHLDLDRHVAIAHGLSLVRRSRYFPNPDRHSRQDIYMYTKGRPAEEAQNICCSY